jgi:hypothetical protein
VRWFAERLPLGSTVAVAPAYVTKVLDYYARREKVQLEFVPADEGAGWESRPPRALALTRLHHVPNREAVIGALHTAYGPRLVQGAVVGYEMWATPPSR